MSNKIILTILLVLSLGVIGPNLKAAPIIDANSEIIEATVMLTGTSSEKICDQFNYSHLDGKCLNRFKYSPVLIFPSKNSKKQVSIAFIEINSKHYHKINPASSTYNPDAKVKVLFNKYLLPEVVD